MRAIFILILSSQLCYGQTLSTKVDELKGIWIAKEFKASFDSSYSMITSKKSFDGTHPVGFRFNPSEINDSSWHIGYGELHSHLFHPEVSNFTVQGTDTIYEQGSISLNLNKLDSAGYYSIPSPFIYSFGPIQTWIYIRDESLTLTWKTPDGVIKSKDYTKLTTNFTETYPFPNPRDYYVRTTSLSGSYLLLDANGKTLSDRFIIQHNGTMIGYTELEGKKIDFNTDVYCGPPSKLDNVLIYNPNNLDHPETVAYVYKKENHTIYLSEYEWNGMIRTVTQKKYTLVEIE